MTADLLTTARAYLRAGFSVIPIRGDGSKAPAVATWKQYQFARPTQDDLREWFDGRDDLGIGVVCGRISGNLVVIDFDLAAVWDDYAAIIETEFPGLLGRYPLARTPGGGAHLYVQGGPLVGNRKLASDPARAPKCTLIETKGVGGYVLAPGSSPRCHPTGGVYSWVRSPFQAGAA
jgi:hypothetical protein